MKEIKKILYPTNLSLVSYDALEYALSIVKSCGARLYLLNVIEDMKYDSSFSETYESNILLSLIDELAYSNISKYIKEKIEDEQDFIRIIKCTYPKEQILKFSEEEHIDLIILSSTGLLTDSINEEDGFRNDLLNKTNIPILFVNNPKYVKTNRCFNVIDKNFNNLCLSFLN